MSSHFYDSPESKFVWKIENFSCLNGERVYSPPISQDKWKIGINKEKSHVTVSFNGYFYSLQSNIKLYISFSFLDRNGKPLIWKESVFEYQPFKFPNENKYFPDDTLRVEFRLWTDSTTSAPSLVFARTRIDPVARVIKKTFSCVIPESEIQKKESSLDFTEAIFNGHNLRIQICLPFVGQMSVNLTTTLFGFNMKIQVFLLDIDGKRIEIGNHNANFMSGNRSCGFNIDASRNMFMRHGSKFLVSGSLSLIFTCTFTGHIGYNSMVDEEMEIFELTPPSNTPPTAASEDLESKINIAVEDPETSQKEEDVPNTALRALQDMLSEGYLSDFTLKVGDRTFPVHKVILGMRSKVFRSMFSSEMKETQDNCVDIKDVDEYTLHRLLQFVYSDWIDKNMDWNEAASLYAAADFYALDPLKKGCRAILEENLSTPSSLGVLALADLHQDPQLKSAALDFISHNDRDIVGTAYWVKFEEANLKLAMETLRELYSRKMNG